MSPPRKRAPAPLRPAAVPPAKAPSELPADPLARLVAEARDNPAFFHALVFQTEVVLPELRYLDRKSLASLVAIDPEHLVAAMIGLGDPTCGATGVGTNAGTGRSCDRTSLRSETDTRPRHGLRRRSR